MYIAKKMIAFLMLIISQTNLSAKTNLTSFHNTTGRGYYNVNALTDVGLQGNILRKDGDTTLTYVNITPALRVNIKNFTGNMQRRALNLHWESAAVVSINCYTIERSTNGNDYKEIGCVSTNKSSIGYYYSDATPADGINYYRLRIVDKYGYITFSKEIALNFDAESISISAVYPNLFKDEILLNITLAQALPVQVNLYNGAGGLCYHNIYKANAGSNKISANGLAKLPAGSYIIEIILGDRIFQQMILKGKK